MEQQPFIDHIQQGYRCTGPYLTFGTAMLDAQAQPNAQVNIPLKSLNRHGLIAGATGTGKTKTVQLFAELLSEQGVPTLLMDLKGDLSGLGATGTDHPKIQERQAKIGVEFTPHAAPIELLSISDEAGVRLRATVSEFGSILLSQILELNSTQRSVLAVVFKYCDDQKIPLITLNDLQDVLKYTMGDGQVEFDDAYGHVSSASMGSIQRKLIELQQQGADLFFGEPSFNVQDLVRSNAQGKGIVSILRLMDLQSRPKLFSTFMLNLLTQAYQNFPEVGDPDKPKLVIVIDEAHLIFSTAAKELLDKIETIIKLIRSKGVGIFFCTQNPKDVPNDILSQLGLKVQHALRAFTAKDRKAIKLVSENFPSSAFYQTDELLTHLGIGEALITGLNEQGRPTPLAATLLQAPRSRMGLLTDVEIQAIMNASHLTSRYESPYKTQSAAECLASRAPKKAQEQKPSAKKVSTETAPPSVMGELGKSRLVRQLLTTFVREVTRAAMVALGIKKTRSRSKKK